MSSLAQQLSAVKQRSGAPAAVHQSRARGTQRPSLLLNHGKAADVDLETIYRLAVEGLDELCDRDEALAPFRKDLFAETSKELVRELQTREVNERIDASVAHYLALLSPYFPLPEAHYTLEYLIRRYNIQTQNVEAICRAILPFHDTEIFVRMVGLLQLDDHSAWSFLKAVQRSQCPVPREALVRRCASDKALMGLVLAAVEDASKHGVLPRHRQLVSFYGAVLLEVLDLMPSVTEEWMRLLLPHLLKGVRRGNKGPEEYQVASYMVLSKICSSTTLSPAVSDAILTALSEGLTPTLADKGFMAMLIVLRSQGLSAVPATCIGPIARTPGSGAALCNLSTANPAAEEVLVPAVLHGLADGAARDRALGSKLLTFIAQLRVPSLSGIVRDIILSLAKSGLAPPEGTPESEVREGAHEVVCKLREREPEAFAEALKVAEAQAKESGSSEVLNALLSALPEAERPASSMAVVDEEDIALGMVMAERQLRIRALKAAGKAWEEGRDEAVPLDAVAMALTDDDYHVVLRALEDDVAPKLLSRMTPEAAVEAVRVSLTKWSRQAFSSHKACKVALSLLEVIERDLSGSLGRLLHLVLTLALIPAEDQASGDDTPSKPKLAGGLSFIQRKAQGLLLSSGHAISIGLKPAGKSTVDASDRLLDGLGRAINASPAECLPLLEEAVSPLASGVPLSDAAKAPYRRLLLCLASAIQAPSSPSGPSLSTSSRRRSSCPPSSALAQSLLPLALTLLKASSTTPSSALALSDLSPLLVALAGSLPPLSTFSPPDALLVSLLSLAPASLTPLLPALQSLLLGRYAHSALPALTCLAAHPPTCPSTPLLAQVQALSVAATLITALKKLDSSEQQHHLISAVVTAFPDLMVALCHPVKRVREGAVLVLVALVPSDDDGREHFMRAHTTPTKSPSKGSAKKKGANGVLAKEHEEGVDIRAVGCLSRGLMEQKSLLVLDRVNAMGALKALLRQDADNRAVIGEEEQRHVAHLLLSAAAKGCEAIDGQEEARAAYGLHRAYTLADVLLSEPVVSSDDIIAELRELEASSMSASTSDVRDLLVRQLMRAEGGKLGAEPFALVTDMLRKEMEEPSPSTKARSGVLAGLAKHGAKWRERVSGKERKAVWAVLAERLEREGASQEVLELVRDAMGTVLEPEELVEAVAAVVDEKAKAPVHGGIMAIELVQTGKAAAPRASWSSALLDRLARMLDRAIKPAAATAGQSGDEEGREYLVILLLETLVELLTDLPEGSAMSSLKVDTLLQILEGSKSLQIRNGAIKLLARLSAREPKAVVPLAMRVLSWLGKESVQQGDAYTFAVVQQVLESVIPAALKANLNGQGHGAMAQIIKIFVDAFDHVAVNRRAALFSCLLRYLGDDTLGALLLLFLSRPNKDGSAEFESEMEFLHNLMLRAKPAQQVLSLADLVEGSRRLLRVLGEKEGTKPSKGADDEARLRLRKPGQKDEDEMEVDGDDASRVMDLRPLKPSAGPTAVRVLTFVSRHLSNGTFHMALSRIMGDEAASESLQTAYLLLCEEVLLLLRVPEDPQAKASQRKFLEQCKGQLRHVLDAIHGLLSTASFVTIIQELLAHDDMAVGRKALQLFTNRIEKHRDSGKRLPRAEQQLIMDLLPDVIGLVSSSDDAPTRQAAWATVATLAQSFGRGFAQSFLPLFDHLTTAAQQAQADKATLNDAQVLSSALLSSAAIIQALGPQALARLPRTMPVLLDALDWANTTATDDDDTREAAVVALSAIIATLPNFLNPFLPRTIASLLHPALTSTASAQRALSLLASSVAPRLLLPVLIAAFPAAQDKGASTVTALIGVVSEAVDHCSRADVVSFLPQLSAFYLQALDYRGHALDKGEEDDEAIVGVEESVSESFVSMVLKLSEDELRPLFLKIAHWKASAAVEDAGKKGKKKGGALARRMAFFRVVNHLAEKLRTIFVPFFGHIWSDVRQELECVAEGDEAVAAGKDKKSAGKKRKRSGSTEDAGQQNGTAVLASGGLPLLELVLSSLHKCFTYDEDGFLTPARFEAVMPLLVSLVTTLRCLTPDDATYLRVCEDLLVPCVSMMACAADKDVLWKPLNHALLMKTRESDWHVRYVALRAVHECFNSVGEEYLVLLPESISFLSELLEDESPEVESLCKKAVASIEELSGESLDSYLT